MSVEISRQIGNHRAMTDIFYPPLVNEPIFFALAIAVPMIAWLRFRTPVSLFWGATLGFLAFNGFEQGKFYWSTGGILSSAIVESSGYAAALKEFLENRTLGLRYLVIRFVRYYLLPAIGLSLLARWRILPRAWLIYTLFIGWYGSILVSRGVSDIYLIVIKSKGVLRDPDLLVIDQWIYLVTSWLHFLCSWAIVVVLLWMLVPRLPAAGRELVAKIRSF